MKGGMTTEVKCHSIISRVGTINMISLLMLTLITWMTVSGRLLYHKVTLFASFSCCTIWKEVTMHRPHLRRKELCSTIMRINYINYSIWNSSAWEIGLLSTFIYSLIYLCQWYLFHTLVIWYFSSSEKKKHCKNIKSMKILLRGIELKKHINKTRRTFK